MSGHDAWLVCPYTQSALTRLSAVLDTATACEDRQLEEIVRYLINQGGKRLRPALLFLAAAFGSATDETLLRAAAALELVHVASLYHDDIMDRARTRRGDASVNFRWGNSWATIAGTHLFACASKLLAALGDSANQTAAEATVALCTGQLREVENAYNLDLSETEHLAILSLKTATLFELPCQLGALLSHVAPTQAEALACYGHHLGLAFQLTDDALDLAGEASQLGKPTATDLREGVYSLPVLLALHRAGAVEAEMRSLLEQMHPSESDIRKVLCLVQESGAINEALDLARQHLVEAQCQLASLPNTPARHSLAGLAEFVLARSS